MRRLTFGKSDRLPVWSADGQYVAFQSEREGDRAIFWQRADFSGTAERLTKPQAGTSHIPESWSSQGNVLTYSVFSDSTRRYSLASLSIETKESHSFGELTSTVLPASDFSPDGRWLAYNVSDISLAPHDQRYSWNRSRPPAPSIRSPRRETVFTRSGYLMGSNSPTRRVLVPTVLNGWL